jgi:hypothetical protein
MGHKVKQRKRLGRTYGGPNKRNPKDLPLARCAGCGGWASLSCEHGRLPAK